MEASILASFPSEELGLGLLEKCARCLSVYLKKVVSPGGFIQLVFRKGKLRGLRNNMLLSFVCCVVFYCVYPTEVLRMKL